MTDDAGDDPGVISLPKTRKLAQLEAENARMAARLAELQAGTTEVRHDLTAHNLTNGCGMPGHERVYVDDHMPVVTCQTCGERLDPMAILRSYARRERTFVWSVKQLRQDRDRLKAEVEELERQRTNLRAAIRRAEKRKR